MPLTRSAPLKRTAMKPPRPKPAVPPEVRELLAARSGGWCEARLYGCTGEATDACHRIARKAGGRPKGNDGRLSNIWHGCRLCHAWATDNPEAAYELGLALREWQNPEEEPLAYRNEGWALIDDLGYVVMLP